MVDKDAFTVISEIIRPETFYEPRHEKIYRAIQNMNMQELPVDFMTVVEQLRKEGTLEEVGGPAYIVELSQLVASSAHIEYHARVLAQKFLARQLIQFAAQIETQAYDEKTHFGSRYDYAAKKLTLFAEASINRLVDQSSSRINALSNLLTPSCNEFIDLLYFIK